MKINNGMSIYGTFPRPPMGYGPQKGMGYGIWERLVHLAGNRLGGHIKVWVMGNYGLLHVWVKTEVTVLPNTMSSQQLTAEVAVSMTDCCL